MGDKTRDKCILNLWHIPHEDMKLIMLDVFLLKTRDDTNSKSLSALEATLQVFVVVMF